LLRLLENISDAARLIFLPRPTEIHAEDSLLEWKYGSA
jgi:hypothetical protein